MPCTTLCYPGLQSFSLTNQTASISETLFTPATDGDFIIGVTGDVVGHDSGGDPANLSNLLIGWTGNDGTYVTPLAITNNYGSSEPYTSIVYPCVIHAVAGQPVTVSGTWVPVGSPVGSQYYDLYITVLGG